MNKRFRLTIDTKIFEDLGQIQDDLPDRSGGHNSFDLPAGLALLGQKDNKIDTIINLKMSGGCWDAPDISFTAMDKGLRKMIKLDRVVAGMALVRHGDHISAREAKMSNDIKRHAISFKNCFEDIIQTIWISTGNNYFRAYRIHKGKEGRFTIAETKSRTIFKNTTGRAGLYWEKWKRERDLIKARLERKEKAEEEAKKRRAAEARKKKEEAEHLKKVSQDIKEAKRDEIPLGEGFTLIRDGNGNYMFWKVK